MAIITDYNFMNRKTLFIGVLIALGFIAAVAIMFLRSNSKDVSDVLLPKEDKRFTLEESKAIAEKWIVASSPTYVFDGFGLKLESSYALECISCYRLIFAFQSNHAGYGNRAGKILAQVVTSHMMTIEVENGVVISAVTDGQFDELTGRLLIPQDAYEKF